MEKYKVSGPVFLPLSFNDEMAEFELWLYEFNHDRWVWAKICNTENENDAPGFPLRIESACTFGHIFHSRKCDCYYQLKTAFEKIIQLEKGAVIYAVDHDARGLGLEAHFNIYKLRQQEHLDTKEVYERLNAPEDVRDYTPVVTILNHQKVSAIQLFTNNNKRIRFFRDKGISVERLALEMPLDEYNMSTLMLEQEDLDYMSDYATHTKWLEIIQASVEGNLDTRMAMIIADNTRELVKVESHSWEVAEKLLTDYRLLEDPESKVMVGYFTDLPLLEELAILREIGLNLLVFPYPILPEWLVFGAKAHGLRLQDWARSNAYSQERPQWEPVSYDAGERRYRRNEDELCVKHEHIE